MRTSPAASRTGSRERARPSSAGAGRTRKIRSERSKAISTTGTWAVASNDTSARAPTSATRGRMAAVPTTAVAVPPVATSSGTSADPTARPAMAKASATPKTRPTTSAGTARWRREQGDGPGPGWGKRPQGKRGPDQGDTTQDRPDQPAPPDQGHPGHAGQDP